MVAGVGFFTDAYDIFAINIASVMLGYVYTKSQKLSTNQDLGVKVATPIGNIIGQLLFGWLADLVGRKRMCTSPLLFSPFHPSHPPSTDGIELMIIIMATLGQTVAGEAHAVNVLGVLIAWRGLVRLPPH